MKCNPEGVGSRRIPAFSMRNGWMAGVDEDMSKILIKDLLYG